MLTHALYRTEFGDPADAGNLPTLAEANQLLDDWVKSDSLRRHMRQVAALMHAWAAERLGLDESGCLKWEIAGLLHDADWDQWPDQHCRRIIEELERRRTDPEVIRAIASHGPRFFGVEPVTDMDKMLYAFDELSGLIHAYSLMRPGGYAGMDVRGVRKRLKDKAFAAQVSRDDIADAARRAALDLDELIAFVVARQGQVP